MRRRHLPPTRRCIRVADLPLTGGGEAIIDPSLFGFAAPLRRCPVVPPPPLRGRPPMRMHRRVGGAARRQSPGSPPRYSPAPRCSRTGSLDIPATPATGCAPGRHRRGDLHRPQRSASQPDRRNRRYRVRSAAAAGSGSRRAASGASATIAGSRPSSGFDATGERGWRPWWIIAGHERPDHPPTRRCIRIADLPLTGGGGRKE